MRPILYRATIHTIQIEPIIDTDKWNSYAAWSHAVYELNKPYVNLLKRIPKKDRYTLILNPHKIDTTDDGRFKYDYWTIPEYTSIMERVCDELDMSGYDIRRLDICLDTNAPYEVTEKMNRLIIMLFGRKLECNNRYVSTDPVTGKMLTTRIQNGDRLNKTLELEHYNRSTVNQSKWDIIIPDRFELRMKGRNARTLGSERKIVKYWIKLLSNIDMGGLLPDIENKLNVGILERWRQYLEASGRAPTRTLMKRFLESERENLYTRNQLISLFSILSDKPEADVKSLMEKRNGGGLFKIYSYFDINNAVIELINALEVLLHHAKAKRSRVRRVNT